MDEKSLLTEKEKPSKGPRINQAGCIEKEIFRVGGVNILKVEQTNYMQTPVKFIWSMPFTLT